MRRHKVGRERWWEATSVVGLKGVRMMLSIEIPLLAPMCSPSPKFWACGGVYKALLLLCELRLGGHCTSRWWGDISTICDHQSFFCDRWVGTLKPSIEMLSLPFTPFTPCLLPLLHVCSLHSPSLPFAPLTPLILP